MMRGSTIQSAGEKTNRLLPDYSVLMSVYGKDDPGALCEALDSMLNQTLRSNDIVVVCDGPLSKELDDVIASYAATYQELHIHRLEKNGGLGHALRVGVPLCRNEFIARMDSDDISVPNRCELELKAIVSDPLLDVVSGTILEFDERPEDGHDLRILPQEHEDILRFAHRRNPLNHVTVMYRKSSVLAAGNYQSFDRMEDYYLWIRMFQQGCVARNLRDILVYVRVGNGMQERRQGKAYVQSQLSFQRYLRKINFITLPEYFRNCAERILAASVPPFVRGLLYGRFLRSGEDGR